MIDFIISRSTLPPCGTCGAGITGKLQDLSNDNVETLSSQHNLFAVLFIIRLINGILFRLLLIKKIYLFNHKGAEEVVRSFGLCTRAERWRGFQTSIQILSKNHSKQNKKIGDE